MRRDVVIYCFRLLVFDLSDDLEFWVTSRLKRDLKFQQTKLYCSIAF